MAEGARSTIFDALRQAEARLSLLTPMEHPAPTLFVMRHGPAEDDSPSGHDFDRALTAPGRERVVRVAQELERQRKMPRVILSSPLVRALQTAELVAQIVRPTEPVRVRREIAPGGDLRGLLFELVRAGTPGVMVVGHEPDVSSVVAGVLSAGFADAFQKAMVVGLHAVEGRPIARSFVLDPRTLAWT